MRALVLSAAAGAACGDGLSGAVRAGLGVDATINSINTTTTVKFPYFPYYCVGFCPSTIGGQLVPANSLAQVKSAGKDLCVAFGSVVAENGTVTFDNMPTYTPGKSSNITCYRALDRMTFHSSGDSSTNDSKNERKESETFEQKNSNKNSESTSPGRAAVLAPAIMGVVGVVVSMLL